MQLKTLTEEIWPEVFDEGDNSKKFTSCDTSGVPDC